MSTTVDFLIGVDGGGSGCRLAIAGPDGRELIRSQGGPAGLALGIDTAWRAILDAIGQAFAQLGHPDWQFEHCAIGLGLAGVHHAAWAEAFAQQAPAFAALALRDDGVTTLLGAHHGEPGAIIAIGTGVIGQAWFGGEDYRTVSGWGFPSGDEGSGAWLGLRAVQATQKALDGRAPFGPLSQAVLAQVGGKRESLLGWQAHANQTTYAQLSPLVLQHGSNDPTALALLSQAGSEIAAVATALDPERRLPLALCGGLAEALGPWLPAELRSRVQPAHGDAVAGALSLIRGVLRG
ncbi:BadF/BadG/BcrA/BcrD ATPase family protein [Chitinimonas lacunae]|uniref:BadF/BadG/BcrA/BcrD ATPase family protein n=1 Tax=Chitinimonas lacunae TaxID=1963018 RepID=A0ABV8MP57_9NEIS